MWELVDEVVQLVVGCFDFFLDFEMVGDLVRRTLDLYRDIAYLVPTLLCFGDCQVRELNEDDECSMLTVSALVTKGDQLIEISKCLHDLKVREYEFLRQFRNDDDGFDFLAGLRRKAAHLKEMAVGSLKTALHDKMGSVEKVMTGWMQQKAGTLKQALANGIAGVLLDSKQDAEAKANVYGALVQGRHTVAVPPVSHLEKIASVVPYDGKDRALDHVDRVGHEIGIKAINPSEVKESPVVENHIVSEMVTRTRTGIGQVGQVCREMAKVSDVMKDTTLEKMIVAPDESHYSHFPIHTRPYHVSLVDGCSQKPMSDPVNKLETTASFSTTGVITGQLKQGIELTVLDTSHHQDGEREVTATLCAIYFFSFSPDTCHMTYSNGIADHDMNINVEITAAIVHDNSSDSSGGKNIMLV
nr:VP4 [Jeddah tick coltivirus]